MSAESHIFKRVIRKRRSRAKAKKTHNAQFRTFTAMVAKWKLFPGSVPKAEDIPEDKTSHVVQDTSKH